ncbi:MAG: carbohydrate kinase family protein, partial [Thermoplasmatota archaeon]
AAGVDLAHVRADGELAVTTALEFAPSRDGVEQGRRNVMLSHAGSVAAFGPGSLDDNARTLIAGSDAVLVANWSQDAHGGTALVAEVARVARAGGTLAFLDTGDPSGRSPADRSALLAAAAAIDVFSVNENELALFGGLMPTSPAAFPQLARALCARLRGPRIDLHTATAAFSEPTGAHAEAFKVDARRATGAGDAWNAGNIVGSLLALPDDARLRLANAVAACYVSSADGRHPTRAGLVEFLGSE